MSVKEIRVKLPIKNIPEIIGNPTYKAINEVQKALFENASATPTTLGGERNGHIGLIMDTAVYDNLLTTAYARPPEPGPYVQHGPGDSAAARADANDIQK